MSLQSELTRFARNVGALTADTNAIFEALRSKGVVVPADAELGDVADLIDTIETKMDKFELLTYFDNIANDVDVPVKGPNSTAITNSYGVQDRQFAIGTVSSISSNDARIAYPVEFVDRDFTFDFFCNYVSSGSGYNVTKCGIFGFMFAFYYPDGDRRLFYNDNIVTGLVAYNNGWYNNSGYNEAKNTNDWRSKSSNHVALVYKSAEKELYCFYNGERQFKLTEVAITGSNIEMQFNVDTYAYTQVALRKGDFSNNLESFTVPTEKYHA